MPDKRMERRITLSSEGASGGGRKPSRTGLSRMEVESRFLQTWARLWYDLLDVLKRVRCVCRMRDAMRDATPTLSTASPVCPESEADSVVWRHVVEVEVPTPEGYAITRLVP
jgi:hypothetical protein